MMNKSDQAYVLIGRTRKAHGITGEIKISIEDRYLEDFLKNERVFLSVKGLMLPFFIANVRGKGEMIVHLEEVSDRDAAIALQSKDIYLRQQDLLSDEEREFEIPEEDTLEYARLKGYAAIDRTAGNLGVIDEVVELPQQEMAILTYQGRELLLPLNKHFIASIDDKKREVIFDLPDGMLDL